MNPKISVLIPAYNAEKTILAAVWSALNQDFDGFEVCVYNDGSSDKTSDLLDGIADERLRVFHGDVNKGIVFARNYLLHKTTAPFVAWLDADDIMLPGRLQAQYRYFQQHPKTDVLGGWAELRRLDLGGWVPGGRMVKISGNPDYLQTSMAFRNPFIQSGIMARNFFIAENLLFDSDYEYTEDYELFLRCRGRGKVLALIQTPVVSYFMPGAHGQKEKEARYNTQQKWARILSIYFPFTQEDKTAVVLDFLRSNARLTATNYAFLKDWLGLAEKHLLNKDNRASTGTKAALLFQWFRLFRLRFGLVAAAFWLMTRNPIHTITMLRNRTRIV